MINFTFFSPKPKISIFDKLVMALNKKMDEKSSEVVLLLETYVKGDKNLKPMVNS